MNDAPILRLDWTTLMDVLLVVSVLALFLERALSLVFEHRLFVSRFDKKGLKEPIAFIVSFLVVRHWDFDVLGMLFNVHAMSKDWWGYAITAAIVAGGSKGSVKLFQDLLGIKSSAVAASKTMNRARLARKN